ncbi:hypothetical protein SFC43_18370 [Bacteroides sp. CR5/BHMF/2]|nr:hypothetical protein [Bacteroides sp. CR5/BHMF/2]
MKPCIPMSLTELMIWLQGAFSVIKSLESKQTEKVTFQDNEYDLNVVKDALNPSMPLLPKMPGLRV